MRKHSTKFTPPLKAPEAGSAEEASECPWCIYSVYYIHITTQGCRRWSAKLVDLDVACARPSLLRAHIRSRSKWKRHCLFFPFLLIHFFCCEVTELIGFLVNYLSSFPSGLQNENVWGANWCDHLINLIRLQEYFVE